MIGVRRTLLLALGLGVGSGLAFVGAGTTGSPWGVVAAQGLFSGAASFFNPVAWDRAASLGRGNARQVIGAMSVAAGVGQLRLPSINGLMVDRFGTVVPFTLFAGGLMAGLVLVDGLGRGIQQFRSGMIGSRIRADHLASGNLAGCLAMTGMVLLQSDQSVMLALTAIGGVCSASCSRT